MNTFQLTRFNLTKGYQLAPKANASYRYQKDTFISQHYFYDRYYDQRVEYVLRDFKPNILVFNPDKGGLPWYASKAMYVILTLLGFGWVLRIVLVNNTRAVSYASSKYIFK